MASNTADKQQESATEPDPCQVQYDHRLEVSGGAIKGTSLVSFHEAKTEGFPKGFLDDVMGEFLNEIHEHRYSGLRGCDDWFIYDTRRTLDRQAGASETLHGITVGIWITIKRITGAAAPDRSYEGRITAMDDSAYPRTETEPLARAGFQVNIMDDENARAMLKDIKERTLACVTALEEYEGDSRTLELHATRMKQAALTMDRVEHHVNGPCH